MAKSFLIDASRCTACRGCQVACKQWNGNPGSETKNWGSYQNPKDFEWNTWKLVRMEEHVIDKKIEWLFFPDQCRHCVVPPCKLAADLTDEGAVLHDASTGAVVFTEKTRNVPYEDVRQACPYDVPRFDPKTKLIKKCTMCNDRVTNGLLPACVQSCPTAALNFGERDQMLVLAKNRLETLKKTRPNVQLIDQQDVNVLFLVEFAPKYYSKTATALQVSEHKPEAKSVAEAAAPAQPVKMGRRDLLASLAKPVRSVTG